MKCPIEYAVLVSCTTGETRNVLYLNFQIPGVDQNLVMLTPESFNSLKRKDNKISTMKLHVDNCLMDKEKGSVYGTNIDQASNHESFLTLNVRKTRIHYVEKTCVPTKEGDARIFT